MSSCISYQRNTKRFSINCTIDTFKQAQDYLEISTSVQRYSRGNLSLLAAVQFSASIFQNFSKFFESANIQLHEQAITGVKTIFQLVLSIRITQR